MKKSNYLIPLAIIGGLFFVLGFAVGINNILIPFLREAFHLTTTSSYLVMTATYSAFIIFGYPSGLIIKKIGYKKTALLALIVGIVGILVQWTSGWNNVQSFGVYLIGAFIAGFCMCMLNAVVNPMLNTLGGGGNKGNQLIQIGGVFNSSAAVAVYIIMGALIGNAAKATIADVTPALFIALAIFIIAFVVILFSKIEEPEQLVKETTTKDEHSAFSFRHFKLGILAIFLYMGIEVGVPAYALLYLTASPMDAVPGLGMDASIAGLIVAVYWLMMLVGRFVGGSIGGKVSSRAMIIVVSTASFILVTFGMFAPENIMVSVPGINWENLSVIWAKVPIGIFAFLLVGLCTSVMWGGIFNMAVEGLGKYTSIASGAFMTMVFGCAVMLAIQAWIAGTTGSYLISYAVVLVCAAYLLFYALIGYKNVNKDIKVD